MSDPRPADVLDLLTQRTWVQRLARGLVRDQATADDLAQQAWLVAARDPERPRDARAFLAGVVRRLASVNRRGVGRREQRERAVARPEALPSSEALLERLELQRLLVESVQALEPHERTAIQLRFFEDLSAEEIARRSGEPAATVRSRIHRGLAHLRARLEARVGREDLMAGLLVLARFEPAAVPPAVRPGTEASVPWTLAAVMKSLTALLITVAAVATGLLLVSRDEDAPRRIDGAGETLAAAAPAALVDPVLAPAPAPEEVATRVETRPSTSSPHEAAPAAPSVPGTAVLVLRTVDEQGGPLAGVSLDRETRELGRSNAAGALTVEVPVEASPKPVSFVLHRPGFARRQVWARLVAGAEVTLGDVVLRPAGEVQGRVVDEDGRPVEGATVLATRVEGERTDVAELRRHGPERDENTVEATSGPDGRFVLADVPAGPVRVWAGADERAWTSVGPRDVRSDERGDDVQLVLEPLERVDRITGFVLDPEGNPVAGADVQGWFTTATYGTSLVTKTDALGAFEIVVRARVAHDLTVIDPENRWAELYWPGVDPGTHDLELVFEPARTVLVHVVDLAGAPLPEAKVSIEALDLGQRMRSQSEPVAVEGEVAAGEEAVVPGDWHVRVPNAAFSIVAVQRGFATAEAGAYEPSEVPDEFELRLEPLPGIHGRVVTPEGEPAAGAAVALVGCVSDLVLQESNGFRVFTDPWSRDTTTTDADGTFTIYPPTQDSHGFQDDGHVLRVDLAGYARTELAPRHYDPEEGVEVEITLLRGGAIEGRARMALRVDPTGFVVAFSRGDGRIESLRLGADGRYRKEGLTPGPWEVRVLSAEPEAGAQNSGMSHFGGEKAPPMEWTCEVVEGQTTVHDLDLTDRAPARIEGRLALVGRDLEGWTASLEAVGMFQEEVLATRPLDADGHFSLTLPKAGEVDLVLRGPAEASGRLELSERLTLETGTTAWSVRLPVAALSGSGATPNGARERFHSFDARVAVGGHELQARVSILADEAGRFTLPTVPAGPATISRNEPPADGQRIAPWEEILKLDLEAGESRTVTLP